MHKKCHKLVQRPCGKDYSDGITTDSGEVRRFIVYVRVSHKLLMKSYPNADWNLDALFDFRS